MIHNGETNAGIAGDEFLDDGRGAVAGAVIDDDDLSVPALGVEAGEDFGQAIPNARRLIKGGDNDAIRGMGLTS